MRMQNVPLSDIVPNPWRDLKLYPIDTDHVAELRASINDHGFFGGIKGRRRNGKIEIGCGHQRIEAARKAKLDSVPIFVDDIDDDAMLRLMTDENATQAGSHPGAVMNEVAAVTRRIIEGLLTTGTNVPVVVTKAFDGGSTKIKDTISKLRNGTDVHLAIGHNVIRRYLGQGNTDRAHRGERQIREAITALKQSGRYDDMVDEAVAKHPQPVDGKPAAKGKTAAKSERKPRRPRVLDERCADVFDNEHQFHAFREAVTTPTAIKVIPVQQQLALAKEIMVTKATGFKNKQKGAPFIKAVVHQQVQEAMKAQRNINKEEREAYLAEQREARIESELHSANASTRSLISSIARLIDLADEFPAHPKLGGFSARLDTLVSAIQQFSKKLK